MAELTGEWFMVEGKMDYKMIKQVLEFQRHGDRRKFGQIALNRHMITGRDLREYVKSIS